MREGLKPCPFCGCDDALVIERDHEIGYYMVVCDFTRNGCGSSACYEETTTLAIAAWNTRADTQLNELMEAVEPVLWDYRTIKEHDEYGLVWISTVYVEHITNLKATLDKIKEEE